MSEIVLLGINHKTAPVELRETLSFTEEEIVDTLDTLKCRKGIDEVLLFSTCNRTEILIVTNTRDECIAGVEGFISKYKDIPMSTFAPSLYIYRGEQAVQHLFRVTSSLDSMIVGEPQILGQVKSAYRTATRCGSSGVILNRLLHKSFSIAKKVRRETGIGDNAVSISYAAIELASKIFTCIQDKNVLLLGAGEMAEIAVEHLISHGVSSIVVANRTFKNALTLAEKFNGRAVRFEERESFLHRADIIISSTGASDHVITQNHVKAAMRTRKNRPLFFIDIAVPRDIDPKVNRISNCYLYDIDDLQEVVNENLHERQKEAVKGERLVDEAVIKFHHWLEELKVVPTIISLKEKIDAITEAETEKTLAGMKTLSEKDRQAIQRMTRAISSKILHDPILFLKNSGDHRNDSFYINAARNLFNLDKIDEECSNRQQPLS
ncbi:MAG: glutamyl-tRNA reductase [Thermodesulfobacteriota bacterium]|nr:glutamyl-tRNA reductase [Thermodesulfobacteriota bacterium]